MLFRSTKDERDPILFIEQLEKYLVEQKIGLTLSIGYAKYDAKTMPRVVDFTHAADQAMYQVKVAKKVGR